MVLWKFFPQGLQQWKSVFNLQEVKTPFSAISPPPSGSDDAVLSSFRFKQLWVETSDSLALHTYFMVTSDRQEHKGDAGIDEGYGEPQEKVHLAGVALRKPCFCQQAKGRRSAYSLHTPCPYTQELLYPCVKVCQQLST